MGAPEGAIRCGPPRAPNSIPVNRRTASPTVTEETPHMSTSEEVKSILMHTDRSRVFYDTLQATLADPAHPAWHDEEVVVWVVECGWGGESHYVEQSWCRKLGNLDIIMRHHRAVDVVIDAMATSKTTWIVDRMATFLSNMQKLDAAFFNDHDCAKMATAIGRLDETRSSHAKIVRRIERVCNAILHPRHQDFCEIEAMFATTPTIGSK